ncbi:hypothetical protein J40TS1_38010 [Paenibacillus montaniterrae]|uniref:Uncharacterized protein n=2 Tax=Paenibacillus montaniterrae TaxID=429341 RepID=A0A920D0P5_9BACL|nr:hypothetical protein J40TS1_38010 [Paenibacillus montaniterrae]
MRFITIGLSISLIIMLVTKPSHEKFEKWILQEYEISCEFDMNLFDVCDKDEKRIDFKSSHFRNSVFLASYEKKYEYENGEKLTIRTLGAVGMLFRMNEGFLWDLLNN